MKWRSAAALGLLAVLATGCGEGEGKPDVRSDPAPVRAVIRAFEQLGGDLWPGFELAAVPLAIFDGKVTWLARHPSPPPGFERLDDDLWLQPGQHDGVRANSSIELGELQTATLMASALAGSPTEAAALAVHEAFHAFQRSAHPSWSANEGALFVYPFDHLPVLSLRLVEDRALREALLSLAVDDVASAACWSRRALEARDSRFATLPAEAATYERTSELNEGLATYVAYRAAPAVRGPPLQEALGAADVRQRTYESGLAQALLLDHFRPGWRAELEAEDSRSLDELLRESPAGEASDCAQPPVARLRDQVAEKSAAMVDQLRAELAEERASFAATEGWSVELVAIPAPLFPEGFDPINVGHWGGGEVLHRRFLKLGNERGSFEVQGHAALTRGAGDHPLYQGVTRVLAVGFAEQPELRESSEGIEIEADGLSVRIAGARHRIDREQRRLRIDLTP